jgi:hypothetical protein
MAEHADQLQEFRKRIVATRRKLVVDMSKSSSDANGLWNDFLKIDATLQAVDRAIEDEEELEGEVSIRGI